MHIGWGKWLHKNGKIRFEGIFVNDSPHGEEVELFYPNGNCEYRGGMSEGKYQGMGKLYHFNGMLWYAGNFEDNAPCGEDCVLYKKRRFTAYVGGIGGGRTEEGKVWVEYF